MPDPVTAADLPVHAPARRAALDSPFARRVLGKREARRLASLMDDAELRARARLEAARREAEEIFADARAEADAILARLPDFAAIEALPARKGRSAYQAIRDVADAEGLPFAVVVGAERSDRAKAARRRAVLAVADACPMLSPETISGLFAAIAPTTVRRILKGGES